MAHGPDRDPASPLCKHAEGASRERFLVRREEAKGSLWQALGRMSELYLILPEMNFREEA